MGGQLENKHFIVWNAQWQTCLHFKKSE